MAVVVVLVVVNDTQVTPQELPMRAPSLAASPTSVPDSGCWAGHGLCLIFTAIDPASPDAKHTLSMHVDDRGTYISAPRPSLLVVGAKPDVCLALRVLCSGLVHAQPC